MRSTASDLAVIVLVWVIAPAVVGFRMGERKNLPIGLALGVLLGWIGILILALLPYRGRRCSACAEPVRDAATICRHCGQRLIGI
jgi:hypothetical protein